MRKIKDVTGKVKPIAISLSIDKYPDAHEALGEAQGLIAKRTGNTALLKTKGIVLALKSLVAILKGSKAVEVFLEEEGLKK